MPVGLREGAEGVYHPAAPAAVRVVIGSSDAAVEAMHCLNEAMGAGEWECKLARPGKAARHASGWVEASTAIGGW
jgi:hypothetical protein